MKMPRRIGATALAAACLAWLHGVPAARTLAQEQGEAPTDESDEAVKPEEKADDKHFAIVGGDVYTGTGHVLRGATVLSCNGVIESIGYDLTLPEGCETLDASGMRVYPGLVALNATPRISQGLFAAEAEAPAGAEPDTHFGIEDRPGSELRSEGHEVREAGDEAAGSGDPAGGGSDAESEAEEGAGAGTSSAGAGEGGNDGEGALAEDPKDDAKKEVKKKRRPKSDVEESFDPFSEYMVLALAAGITTVDQSSSAVKLKRGDIAGILIAEKRMSQISWSRINPSGMRQTVEKFEAAARYLRERRAWEERGDKEEKEPSKKGVDSTILKVLKGDTLARFNADEREDLLDIARLAQRFGFRPVLWGCREGWTVADELGRAGAFAVVTPRERRPKEEQLVRAGGSSIENAAILHRSGVQVAVLTQSNSFDLSGMTGRDLTHYPIEADFAVRGGLSEQAALQAMTIVPARLLGCDHRVGTLEPGKDCDVIVTDGDLLHYQTFVQYAVVDGKLVYDKQKEIFFAHIRPRPEKPTMDPGEAEAPAPDEAEEGEKEAGEQEESQEQGESDDGQGTGDEKDEKKDERKDG
jgi:imidazolonepropionase-like amidohydrolase